MSTSAQEATTELSHQMPSCSSPSLDCDVLETIFRRAAQICPLKTALNLKAVSRQAGREVSFAMRKNEHIRIEVRPPTEYRIVGMKKEKLSTPIPNILVQGSSVSVSEGVSLLRGILREAAVIRRLSIDCQALEFEQLNELLDQVIASDKVQLEVIQVKRRKGGVNIPKVAELIRANSSTLKYIGRIGLSEAASSFDNKLRVDRVSLMPFDLGVDASDSTISAHLLAIAASGAHIDHLSFTSYTGLDPTDDTVQAFLDAIEVRSLRLTMMRGPMILPQPDYMVGKVRRVCHLEVGEVVEKPNIFNQLVTYEKTFLKVFPGVTDITFFQQW